MKLFFKDNDFTYYKVFVVADKGHRHFSFIERTFDKLTRAVYFANKYDGAICIINTFRDGRIEVLPFHE